MSHKPPEDGGSRCFPSLQVKNKWILSMPSISKQDDHWSTIELFTSNELVTSSSVTTKKTVEDIVCGKFEVLSF